jgi:hypothetical protein
MLNEFSMHLFNLNFKNMRQKMISIIAMTVLIFSLSSCTLGDNTINPADLATPEIVQNGTWKVTLYNDCGDDETYHFAGYGFIFDTLGVVTALKDSLTLTGIWSTGTDDGHNMEKTSSKIRLEDISGGNEPNDYLTFEKN